MSSPLWTYRMALGAAVAALTVATALAGTVGPGDVEIVDDSAIPASLTGVAGDPVAGKDVFTGRKLGNCLACHQVSSLMDEQQFHGEVAPPLDGVADRYSEGELRLQVVNSKVINEDTLMPAFYRVEGLNRVNEKFEGKTILTAQQVEDVVAYLQTLKE
ncbi:MAG: sulfur oxidation c-type cytochrome SoxX [Pseudomonadota bacterium]